MEGAYPALQMRTNGVVFEGGHLWGPWVPAEANMREIEGRTFYAIRKSDSQFAKAMGLDVQGFTKGRWESPPVLTYVKDLRNKTMEAAIIQAEVADDDGATDAIAEPKFKRPRYARCSAVPSVIEIEIPQMECEGRVLPTHAMKLASTANYGCVIEFELTVANVEYLYHAIAASPPSYFDLTQAARKKRRCFKLKPMYSDTPDVVECRSKPIAKTSYLDINGRWHQHSQRIRVLEEHCQLGTAEEKRREVALAVQKFRDEHHHNVVAERAAAVIADAGPGD